MKDDTLIDIFDVKSAVNRPIFQISDRLIFLKEFLNEIECAVIELKFLRGNRVALCFQDSYQFTISFFACLLSKKTPILLPNNQAGTLLDFKSEYDAILNEEVVKQWRKEPISRVSGHLFFNKDQSIVLFTSGSTGKAKKVIRTLKQLFCEISTLENTFINSESDMDVYASVSHQHIYGLIFLLLWPLHKGRTINLPILNYPEEIELLNSNHKPFILVSSPALLKRLSIINNKNNTPAKSVIFSSGGLLEKTYADTVFHLFNIYPYEILGSTETGGIAYRQQHNNFSWSVLPKVFVSIDNQTGCLKVNSRFFTDNAKEFFLMGDRVKFSSNNHFELLGRLDRIVKIEEKRISLVEIENQIKQYEFIKDAYALALESNRQYIAMVIELNDKGERFLSENKKLVLNKRISQYLLSYFDRILLPKKFRYVDNIPTNNQGKRLLSEMKVLFENDANEIS